METINCYQFGGQQILEQPVGDNFVFKLKFDQIKFFFLSKLKMKNLFFVQQNNKTEWQIQTIKITNNQIRNKRKFNLKKFQIDNQPLPSIDSETKENGILFVWSPLFFTNFLILNFVSFIQIRTNVKISKHC